MMNSFSDEHLKRAFEENISVLSAKIDRFPFERREAYAMWLAQTYYLVRHTARFLCLVAGKYGPEDEKLHKAALHHIRQEQGHDEIALVDLRKLGYQPQDFDELPETRAMIHSQYYWIEHVGPMAHFGYSLCLEGLAALKGKEVLARLEKSHDRSPCQFMRVHAMEDVSHFDEGLKTLAQASPRERSDIINNLNQSCKMYGMMLDEVTRLSTEYQLRTSVA